MGISGQDDGQVSSETVRPWGRYELLYSDENMWLKKLIILPGQSLSLQVHYDRTEYWHVLDSVEVVVGNLKYYVYEGEFLVVEAGTPHRITNYQAKECALLEWAVGRPDENDIVRLKDNYGRA